MLLGHIFYARFYAATIMDERLFDETLDYILDTPMIPSLVVSL